MAIKTAIQWCDSSINPTKGCDGCEILDVCYAHKGTKRFGGKNPGFAKDFLVVELAPGRMAEAARWPELTGVDRPNKPWLNGMPRAVFVGDMSDVMSRNVPFEYLRDEIIANATSDLGRRHIWMLLTKRPRRLASFARWLRARQVRWPDNIWVGTSITNQRTAVRLGDLLDVGGRTTTRFVSLEPQMEKVELGHRLRHLDWLIQGGMSGVASQPFDLAWAQELVRDCEQREVPFFLKQLGLHVIRCGRRLHLGDRHGGDWNEWPEELRVREMPAWFDSVAKIGKNASALR